MLRSLKDIESYDVSALDGKVGKVTDFLFDDQQWTTRYMVTDTGGFWGGPKQVLISPISFRRVDWSTRMFNIGLTQAKVKSSPSVDLDRPVSRQYEQEYSQYYGWPTYWGSDSRWVWGMGAYPLGLADGSYNGEQRRTEEANNDPNLRSAKEVAGYRVHGSDGEIGHVADFVVDDETWTIRYLVVDTSNWWFGKKVLVAPYWANKISWSERAVHMDLTLSAIKSSPEWNPEALVNREYEARLYDYYGRPVYWSADDTEKQVSVRPAEAKHPNPNP